MNIFELLSRLLDGAWFLLSHITGRSSFLKPLSKEKEAAAIERMVAGDAAAHDELIVHNMRLVVHIAKKYAQSGIEHDDLVSIGSIGLIKAVDTFKPENGRLAAYASRCIENEILMALRSNKKNRANVSLYEPIGYDHDGNEVSLSDILGTDADMVVEQVRINIDSSKAIAILGNVLDNREKTVILLRYGILNGIPYPQHEVANVLGISRSYVSRIESKAISKLKDALEQGDG